MKTGDTKVQASVNTLKILTLSLLISMIEVSGRKTYLVKQEHPSVTIPKVTGYDNSWCITGDDSYSCLNI